MDKCERAYRAGRRREGGLLRGNKPGYYRAETGGTGFTGKRSPIGDAGACGGEHGGDDLYHRHGGQVYICESGVSEGVRLHGGGDPWEDAGNFILAAESADVVGGNSARNTRRRVEWRGDRQAQRWNGLSDFAWDVANPEFGWAGSGIDWRGA